MTPQTPKQLGMCSWSTHPKGTQDLIDRMEKIGLKKVQIGLNPIAFDADHWTDAYKKITDAGLTIVSGMFGTKGEDYSTLDTIRQTGGFIQDHLWDENWRIVSEVTKVAKQLRLKLVSTHAGFIPEDRNDKNYKTMLQRVGLVADHLRNFDLTLLLETGQETAATLSGFLDQLGRENVGVNFDPANMILYAKGDPIQSLKKIIPRVRQLHIKDATKTTTPGTWGTEVPIGDGDVDWPALFAVLMENDFKGNLCIEREAGENRVGDIRLAVERIGKVMAQGA